MKYTFMIVTCLLASVKLVAQITPPVVKKGVELKAHYTLQRPFYSVNVPLDIVALPKDWRLRSTVGLDARYYLEERWFATYGLSYSQQGGSYKEQYTNASYLKNGIYFGFSEKHHRKLILEIYTGLESNLLLSAKFKTRNKKENVKEYFSSHYFSIPLGIGIKTLVAKSFYLTFDASAHFGSYKVSSQEFISAAQIVFPAFRFGISKFIKN